MIDELIENIRRAEKQSDEDIHRSMQRAKEIESDANNRAAAIREQSKAELRAIKAAAVREAEGQAEKKYNDIICEAEAQAEKLSLNANIDKAAEFIANRILG